MRPFLIWPSFKVRSSPIGRMIPPSLPESTMTGTEVPARSASIIGMPFLAVNGKVSLPLFHFPFPQLRSFLFG